MDLREFPKIFMSYSTSTCVNSHTTIFCHLAAIENSTTRRRLLLDEKAKILKLLCMRSCLARCGWNHFFTSKDRSPPICAAYGIKLSRGGIYCWRFKQCLNLKESMSA